MKETVQAGGGKAVQGGAVSTGGSRNWLPWVIGILAVIAIVVIVGGKSIWKQNDDTEARNAAQTAEARVLEMERTATPTATSTPDFGAPMVLIPAGAFKMGSEDGYNNESPVHEVYLDDYYMDVYEVTNEQYAAFLNEMGNQEEGGVTWLDAGEDYVLIHRSGGTWEADGGYGDHPVIEVSWYGARAYCEWRGGRLPTEAELNIVHLYQL